MNTSNPQPLKHSEHVLLYAHLVTSNQTALPYRFYDIPGCLSPIRAMLGGRKYKRTTHRRRSRDSRPLSFQERDDSTLSNLFLGDEVQRPAPYLIHVTQDQPCTPLCHTSLDYKEIRQLRQLIQRQYRVQMSIRNKTVTERDGQLGYPIGFFQPRQQAFKKQPTSIASTTGNNTIIPQYHYSRYKSYDYAIYNHVNFEIHYRQDQDLEKKDSEAKIQITHITALPVSISHQNSASSVFATRNPSSRYNTCEGGDRNGMSALGGKDPMATALWLPQTIKPSTRLTIVHSYKVQWVRSDTEGTGISTSSNDAVSNAIYPILNGITPPGLGQNNNNQNIKGGRHIASRWSTGTALLLSVIIPVFVLWTTKKKNHNSGNHKAKNEQREIELLPLTKKHTEERKELQEKDDELVEDYDWMDCDIDDHDHDQHHHHHHHHNHQSRDLFVATPLPPVVCQLSGLGAQLFASTIILLLLQPLHLRPLVLSIWTIYAVCGFVAGYVSARLQKLFLVSSADRWAQITWHTVFAELLLPFLAWFFLLTRNVLLVTAGAATATNMKSSIILICLTTFVQIPLAVAGVCLGYRSPQFPHQSNSNLRILERSVSSLSLDDETGHNVDDDDPKKRIVKPLPWYLPLTRNMAGGVVPFCVLHPEWYLWIQTIWNVPVVHLLEESYQNDVWYALFLMMIVCCESCVLVSCLDWYLQREQYTYHHQWWRSFWNGASIGLFFLLYSLQYAWRGLHLVGWISLFLYSGVTVLMSLCIGLFGGFFGVFSSLGFALYLYYYEKNAR